MDQQEVKVMNKMRKRLYKSRDNAMIAGVCGGIAEYFDLDPTLIRLGWIIFCAMGGSGFIAYIIAAIIIPYGQNWWGDGFHKDCYFIFEKAVSTWKRHSSKEKQTNKKVIVQIKGYDFFIVCLYFIKPIL